MQRFGIILVLAVLVLAQNVHIVHSVKEKAFCSSESQQTCMKLANDGDCQGSESKLFMNEFCKEFCENCAFRVPGRNVMTEEPKEPQHEYDCKDRSSPEYCATVLERGHCIKSANTSKKICAETCGFCVWDSLCLDRRKDCDKLALEGGCKINVTYMNDYCPSACGKCDELCLDNSKKCHNLTRAGECGKNITIMNELCPLSCGKCGELCLDTNKKCEELASMGECQKNFTFMFSNCPLSCGKCRGDVLCLDRNKKCAALAKKGECINNSTLMTEMCTATCQKCDDFCLDTKTNCFELASNGNCETNFTFMAETCPISCNKCNTDGLRGGKCNSFIFEDINPLTGPSNPFPSSDCVRTEKDMHYPCRAMYANGLYLGTATNKTGSWQCWISWIGITLEIKSPAQILTDPEGDDLKWVRSGGKFIPSEAIAGGISASGDPLIIARCSVSTETGQGELPGYVARSSPNTAFYVYEEKEYTCDSHDVLTCGEARQDGFCLDKSTKCPTLAAVGECQTNDTFMAAYCPLSCKKCSSTGDCLDKTKKCVEMAENGNCDLNFKFMSENCPSSCKICKTDCNDKHYDCLLWVNDGQCEKNVGLMKKNCEKSCGFCRPHLIA